MHLRSTLIEYVLICIGRNTIHMYDKYISPILIPSSYCQWVMAPLLLDWPLTWRLPGLVVPARGITPAGIVFRITEEHKPPHHHKVATTGEVLLATAKLLYKRWKSDVWPAWSEILANYKKRSSFCVWQNYFKELECLESMSICVRVNRW